MPVEAGQQKPSVRAGTLRARETHDSNGHGTVAVASPMGDARTLMDAFARTGDERSFEELVRRYSGMVHAVCSQVTHNAHDAEDATQAVFLTLAMELRGGGPPIRSLGAWLQQVAHRVSLDLYKSRKRRIAREDRCRQMKLSDNQGFSPSCDSALDEEELKLLLRDELNQLPTRYRTPMILYYFGGMTPVSIARQLGCRPKALGMRLFRGRKMLAEQLASRGLPIGAAALAVALASALACTVQSGVADALAGVSAAAGAGAGSGAGAGASFGFNVTNGFNAGPIFGPSYGVGNSAKDLAPLFVRVMRTLAGNGIKLSGRAKLVMALALLIASGVGGSSQLVRNVVSAAGQSWLSPLKLRIGDQMRRMIRLLPDSLSKPTVSVSSAPAPAATPAQPLAKASPVETNLPPGTFIGVGPRLQSGFAIAPSPAFAPGPYNGSAVSTTPPSLIASAQSLPGASAWRNAWAVNEANGHDPFRLPTTNEPAGTSVSARVLASAGAMSSAGASSSPGAGHDRETHVSAATNHAIAAINRWMIAAETASENTGGGTHNLDGGTTTTGLFHENEGLSAVDAAPQLSAEQWLAFLVRLSSRDERFSLLDPQTLADLATRAVADGWDGRVLTTDRLARALGLTDLTGDASGQNPNSVLSLNHTITPVPEPVAISLTTIAGGSLLLRRRRRQ